MGHRVPNHKSKCRNLHGHRYKIEAGVNDKVITKKGVSNEGMVIDYGDLKAILMKVVDEKLDHGLLLYEHDTFAKDIVEFGLKTILVPFIPTAENIAKYLFNQLRVELKKKKISLEYVRIWETPTSTAVYTLENSFEDDDIEQNQNE